VPPGPAPALSPPSPGPRNLAEAYQALGLPPDRRPGHVINRRRGQVMIHLGTVEPDFSIRPLAIWSNGTELKVLTTSGEFHAESPLSTEFHLTGGAAVSFEVFVQIARASLERIEDVDRKLGELEKDPLRAPLVKVLELKRHMGVIRAELGRAITGLAEVQEGRIVVAPEGPPAALPTVREELLRLRDMTQATQSALTDIFMIRQTDQANQLQLVSNRMASVSNRIAELANISNIRMLGLSYVTLILAVVATVILFPNTAATILGMPSAAGIPNIVVYMALVGTAVAPIAWFASQRWIRDLFKGMARYEARVTEGIADLPEEIPEVRTLKPEASLPPPPAKGAPTPRE
jgi:hypothetical protein